MSWRTTIAPFALVLMFTGSCASTHRQTAASPASAGLCQQLVIIPTTAAPNSVTINQGGVVCTHGSVAGLNYGYSPATVEYVTLKQDATFGPDCNITFQVGSSTYVINAQQDLCVFKAGTVTASVVSGDATITSTSEGSFSDDKSGTVNVTLNVP